MLDININRCFCRIMNAGSIILLIISFISFFGAFYQYVYPEQKINGIVIQVDPFQYHRYFLGQKYEYVKITLSSNKAINVYIVDHQNRIYKQYKNIINIEIPSIKINYQPRYIIIENNHLYSAQVAITYHYFNEPKVLKEFIFVGIIILILAIIASRK